MTYCEDLFSFVECPRNFDDPKQTACCPDGQGCCFPGAASEAISYINEASVSNEYWNNIFILGCLLIFAAAIFSLCCDSSSSSTPTSRQDEDILLVRQDSKPFEFQTVSAGDEYDRTLRILQHRGVIMATAPPLDQSKADQYYTMGDGHESRPSYSPPSLASGSVAQSEVPPPPYGETHFVNTDMSMLRLPAGVAGTSSQSRTMSGDNQAETLNSPVLFVPR